MNSGFYKNDNGQLLYGPNFVLNKDYELRRENKDHYTYPVDGWFWFDNEDEAYVYFNIEKPLLEDQNNEFI
jgi:hypothetical protein